MTGRHLNLDRIEFVDNIINLVSKFGDFKVQISSLHSTDFAGIKLKVRPIPARQTALSGGQLGKGGYPNYFLSDILRVSRTIIKG